MIDAWVRVCATSELLPGESKVAWDGDTAIVVFNYDGDFYALEDRCSHDDGPLAEGDFDCDDGYAVCPRHGAQIDIRTGEPLSLPAVFPVDTFPVRVEDGLVKVELP